MSSGDDAERLWISDRSARSENVVHRHCFGRNTHLPLLPSTPRTPTECTSIAFDASTQTIDVSVFAEADAAV